MTTLLSTFTGLGGLDLGLEFAGFRTVACVEINHDARASIAKNRPAWNLLPNGNIMDVAATLGPSALGMRRRQLGVLAGGPPCQPFSKAAQWRTGRRVGLDDPRAQTLSAFVRLIDRFLPRIILIENVVGFVRGKSSALGYLRSEIDKINYRNQTNYILESKVLNAIDYGVPQRRFRAIVFAERSGKCLRWPTPSYSDRPVRAWDAIAGIRESGKYPVCTGYWSGLLESIPEGSNYLHHTSDGDGVPLFGTRTRFWSFLLKLAKDQPSWTLPATPGPSTGPFHWDNRPLTAKERLRLQTFPMSWFVNGTFHQQTKQIGNATPALLGEVLGRELGAQFFGMTYHGQLTLAIPRKRKVPPPVRPRDVPKNYRVHIGTHQPHPGEGMGPAGRGRR